MNFTIENGNTRPSWANQAAEKPPLLNIIATLEPPHQRYRASGGPGTLHHSGNERVRGVPPEKSGLCIPRISTSWSTFLSPEQSAPSAGAGPDGPAGNGPPSGGPVPNRLGLGELLDHYPYEVSGGQKQRCGSGTGSDHQSPADSREMSPSAATFGFQSTRNSCCASLRGSTARLRPILMVTHSTRAASHAGRVLFIKDGIVYQSAVPWKPVTVDQFYQKMRGAP